MIDNLLYETPYVEQIYTEYLTHINRYQNKNRRGIFCRYYNININASDYNTEMLSTFDRYSSGIVYDIYDYTPLYSITPIVNEIMNDQQSVGQRFIANSDITIFTIKEPHIEDLVVFNNNPLNGSEIFRVSNIRASINSMNSNPNTYWFQNSIEYANIPNLDGLHILNHYIYSIPMEKYLLQSDFINFVNNIKTFTEVLKIFQKKYFDPYQELYFIYINGHKFFPKYENRIIYTFLTSKYSIITHFSDQFNLIKRPYTVKYIEKREMLCDCLNEVYTNCCKDKDYTVSINDLDVNFDYDIFDIANLMNQWVWYGDKEKYTSCPETDTLVKNIKDDTILESDGLLYQNGKNINLILDVRQLPVATIEAAYGCL